MFQYFSNLVFNLVLVLVLGVGLGGTLGYIYNSVGYSNGLPV